MVEGRACGREFRVLSSGMIGGADGVCFALTDVRMARTLLLLFLTDDIGRA